MEPCFAGVPGWVRTFYWMPILGSLARRWLRRLGAYRPAEPPSSSEPRDDGSAVREPRHPRPFAGAGAVALDEPIDDPLDGSTGAYGSLEGPVSPTSAA
jgi:hypothetical protein